MEKTARSFGTHDGSFHADEVTACALLIMFNLIDREKVHRTRDPELLKTLEFVCDVGGTYDPSQKLFDHHQADYNGPLSSAGMVWNYLHDQHIITESEFRYFNESLIIGVDAHDNGKNVQPKGVCTYSHMIAGFLPIPHDSGSKAQDAGFQEALDFAIAHLKRMQNRYQYIQSCSEIMKEKLKNPDFCLIFEKRIPWLELFFELGGETHPAKFLIMPSGEHWTLRGIPPTYEDRMNVRLPLPEQWAGLLEGQLKEKTGIPGAVFCHKGRFISVWETKEDALKALEYIISQSES